MPDDPLEVFVSHRVKDALASALFDQLRSTWWAPAALILSYLVLCPLGVPASPMMIAGGMVFGPVWGSVYNVTGTFLGGTATYFLGRGLGRGTASAWGGTIGRVSRR